MDVQRGYQIKQGCETEEGKKAHKKKTPKTGKNGREVERKTKKGKERRQMLLKQPQFRPIAW